MTIGNAKLGDKTLLDCLIPAVEAFEAAKTEDKSFAVALEAMKAAAETGKNETKNMVAKVGRAASWVNAHAVYWTQAPHPAA